MRRTMALAIASLAVCATPAAASEHLMIVNEVGLSEGGDTSKQFIELIDPVDEPFPNPSYGVAGHNGAGASVADSRPLAMSSR